MIYIQVCQRFNFLTAGAAYIQIFIFISTLTRLWRGPEISVIQGDHSDTRPGDLRVW